MDGYNVAFYDVEDMIKKGQSRDVYCLYTSPIPSPLPLPPPSDRLRKKKKTFYNGHLNFIWKKRRKLY